MNDLTGFKKYFGGYTELRRQTNYSNFILINKGNIVANTQVKTGGVSARAMNNGSWGMASSPEFTDEAIASVIKSANENAVFLSSRINKESFALHSSPAIERHDLRTKAAKLTQGEKIDFCRKLDDYIEGKYPRLMSRTVRYYGIDMEKDLVTSDGSESYSFIPRSHVYLVMTAERNGEPVELFEICPHGGLGEFEDFFSDPEALYPFIDSVYEKVMKKAEGIYTDGGLKECILAPDIAGILAHEAVGHTVESDLVLSGAISGRLMDQVVASELVTMVDFANTAFGKTCQVPVYVDDEGIKAEDAVLIDKGILRGYMQNKQNAAEMGHTPKGNARAFAFSDEPLIRMRNTCIVPGESKLEDMIASVEDGYYLSNPLNGQADMTSEFMFAVSMGYEIKNGKLGRAILDTTVSGVAFDMLKTITMVSDDLVWTSSGFCGKKQPMSVGMGGSAVKCRIMVGGK